MHLNVEQQVLEETGSAYLLIDANLRVRAVGGRISILGDVPPQPGDVLLDLLTELVGNEGALLEILAGQRDRLFLPLINHRQPDGSIDYLDLLTVPSRSADGTINGLLQIVTDTTQRSLAEQAFAQRRNELQLLKDRIQRQNMALARTNADLVRATRMKDEFLASMSHEVRTPLTAILGLAEILRAQYIDPLSEDQLASLRGIEEGGRHLLALINDYLDIAKIEAGRLDLDWQTVLASDVCQSVFQMVADLAKRAKLTLRLDLDPQVTVLHADPRRLRQILINLLSNAIKFTPPGGAIGLELRGDPDQGSTRFTVWDTGIGISAEDALQLFQPFHQLTSDRAYQLTGSGLGLALVAKLTRLHGGGVSLESTPGQGSRFSVVLPWEADNQDRLYESVTAKETPPPEPHDLPPASPVAANRPILLVEDDSASAGLIGHYLRRCGYQVVHVESGEEALAFVEGELPCLAVMDIRMRAMDGLEAIRRLRDGVATRRLPILALTALAMPGDRERCLDAGADVYMPKPMRLRVLATLISELLERHARTRAAGSDS